MLSQRSYKTALKRFLLRKKNPYDINRPPRPRPPRKPFRWRPKKMDIDYPFPDDPMDLDELDQQLWEMDIQYMDYVMEDVFSSDGMLLCFSPALCAMSPLPWRSPSPLPLRSRVPSSSPRRVRVPSSSPRRVRVPSSSPCRVPVPLASPSRYRTPSPSSRRAPVPPASPSRYRTPSPSSRRAPVPPAAPSRYHTPSPPSRRARVPCPLPRRDRAPSSSPRRSMSPAHRQSLSPLARRSRSPSPPRGRRLVRSPRGRLASPSPARARRLERSSRGRLASLSPLSRWFDDIWNTVSGEMGMTSPAGRVVSRSPTPLGRSRSRSLSCSPPPRPRSRAPSPDAGLSVSCSSPAMSTAGQYSRPASPLVRDRTPPTAENVYGVLDVMDMLQLSNVIQELDAGFYRPSSQMADREEDIFRSPDPLSEAGLAWGFVEDLQQSQDGEPEDVAGGTSDSSG
ncbi:hypothetical protein INT44_008023 [Umbelopsis vinacea]|uniref:Uncharacterized protein n=1 Tax=Umbelopsis vinacea TaxID=44442 RepID=A0A8H7PNW2_9FUNG|nr:hypothetical protein INT44_008023 [Umbelopsis vinacea]